MRKKGSNFQKHHIIFQGNKLVKLKRNLSTKNQLVENKET